MNNPIKMRIANLIGEISKLSAIMTATTKHDAFVRFSAHVGTLYVDIHIDGYERGRDCHSIGGFGWSTDCNINCNDTFMSNDEDLRFNDDYHDRQSIFMLEQVIDRLNMMISGSVEVTPESVESPINIDVDGNF